MVIRQLRKKMGGKIVEMVNSNGGGKETSDSANISEGNKEKDDMHGANGMDKMQQIAQAMTASELMVLLRPFFWPDAGTESATSNRVRSSCTWLSVLIGRICNVYSHFSLRKPRIIW